MQGLKRGGQEGKTYVPNPLVAKRNGSLDPLLEYQADLVGGDTQHLPFRS